jgi:hypothetical protein
MLELIVIAGAGIVLLGYAVAVETACARVTRTVARSFPCPVHRREVSARFVERLSDGARLELRDCSLHPRGGTTCGAPCLALRRWLVTRDV